jgi:hypothetical protein
LTSLTLKTNTPAIPEIDQISLPWLREVLGRSGQGTPPICGFAVNTVGTGQAAICARISLQYDGPHAAFPTSLVAKFASDNPSSRKAGKENKTYLREVNFYRYLSAGLSIRTPKCHYADISDSGGEFVLLLEDLAPAEQGDQIGGCTPALARTAVLELVGLHAPSWRNAQVLDLDWLADTNTPGRARAIAGVYRQALPAFMDRCTSGLTFEERRLIERLADSDALPSEYPLIENYCLTHNDYRVDNLLIDEAAGSIHVVDWQTLTVGNPMRDVAYFLGGCLLPDQRAAIEQALVGEYHARLLAAGVAGFDWDQCWADYRRATFHGIMTAVAGAYFMRQTARGDRLFGVMAQRHARQALDVGASEFLS